MKISHLLFTFVVSLLLSGCSSEQRPATKVISPNPISKQVTSPLTLLYFQAENSLEVWTSTPQAERLLRFPLYRSQNFPVGRYTFAAIDDNLFQLQNTPQRLAQAKQVKEAYPNNQNPSLGAEGNPAATLQLSAADFASLQAQLRERSVAKVLVFPNDTRRGGPFLACLSCPYWTAEVYAALALELRAFPLSLE